VVGNPYDDLIANIHKGDFVLDLGCGRGFGILTVAQRIGPKGRYLGVDINSKDVGEARAVARKVAKWLGYDTQNYEVTLSDACNLGVKDGAFDCVIACDILHTLVPEDACKVLKEASRVCKTDGRFEALVYAKDFRDLHLRQRKDWGYGDEWKKKYFLEECAFYSKKELQEQLDRAGFSSSIRTVTLDQMYYETDMGGIRNEPAYRFNVSAKKVARSVFYLP